MTLLQHAFVEKLALSLDIRQTNLLCKVVGLNAQPKLSLKSVKNAKFRILRVCSVPGFLQGKSLQTWLCDWQTRVVMGR